MTALTDVERLDRLTQQWKHAKQEEQSWNQQRIAIESEIYELVEKDLPDKGTYALDSGMKIATGFTEDWDQEKLSNLEWVAPVRFPFQGHWKPDGKALLYIRENLPDVWKKLSNCLTIKPKKPAFSLPEKK